jgi:hypothetical protein
VIAIKGTAAVVKMLGNNKVTGAPMELGLEEEVQLSTLLYHPD